MTYIPEISLVPFQRIQGWKIYSFINECTLTFHHQCVLVVVRFFANRFSIIIIITIKSTLTKLNGMKFGQI